MMKRQLTREQQMAADALARGQNPYRIVAAEMFNLTSPEQVSPTQELAAKRKLLAEAYGGTPNAKK